MKERILKNWPTTVAGVLVTAAVYSLIWFEKLPGDWITQSAAVLPVIVGGWLKKK